MLTIEKLNQFGADTDDGLKRCMNMEDFYLELVSTVLDDAQLNELTKAVNAGNLEKAFESAHALKGVYANLALTPLYEPVSEMTELLRSRTETDYQPFLEKITIRSEELRRLAE